MTHVVLLSGYAGYRSTTLTAEDNAKIQTRDSRSYHSTPLSMQKQNISFRHHLLKNRADITVR